MGIYIGLLRGINVGGHRTLSMANLRGALESAGCRDVRTYIQSGNIVFRSAVRSPDRAALLIRAAVETTCGFAPGVVVKTLAAFQRIAAANPFPEADAQPKRVHVFFLAAPAKRPDLDALRAIATPGEKFVLTREALYVLTPGGFGPSKLAARAERLLGVEATARNWRTVTALLELLPNS